MLLIAKYIKKMKGWQTELSILASFLSFACRTSYITQNNCLWECSLSSSWFFSNLTPNRNCKSPRLRYLGVLSVSSEDSVPRANPQENLTFASGSVLRFESLDFKLILQDGGRSLFWKRRRQTGEEVCEVRHEEQQFCQKRTNDKVFLGPWVIFLFSKNIQKIEKHKQCINIVYWKKNY